MKIRSLVVGCILSWCGSWTVSASPCDPGDAFIDHSIVCCGAASARSVYSIDLDGDGDQDVLSASFDNDMIAWYENTDSRGTFGFQQVITTLADGATSVFAADMDGDGDPDVLSASENDDKIAWYQNLDGRGTFGPQSVITTMAMGAQFVFGADLDGDGDTDVLSASRNDHKIAWYENLDSAGGFGPQQVITTLAFFASSVFAADLDRDGDLDVLASNESSVGAGLAWYQNLDGAGDFGPGQAINSPVNGASSVLATDLDGDGDMDVLSASRIDDRIVWNENEDGAGSFGPQQNISGTVNEARSVHAADLDGDGDHDVLFAADTPIGDPIGWFENLDGAGNFGPQQGIGDLAHGAWSVVAADLDADGDPDVLSASVVDDKIAWYENLDGVDQFGRQQVIVASLASSASSVFASDLDGDGDQDVLSASFDDDKIAWYENLDGTGTFGPQQVISILADGANALVAADFDGDGDMDVLSGGRGPDPSDDPTIAWYENLNGAGLFGVQRVISSFTSSTVLAVDLDGDGDQDVVSGGGGFTDHFVDWYENLDGAGTFGPRTIISHLGCRKSSIVAVDLDDDGDHDLLTIQCSSIIWFEHLDGAGSFAPLQIITGLASSAKSVFAADLDGDGDDDVVSASSGDDKVAWYENLDGAGLFGPQQIITTRFDGASSIFVADVNGDGAPDVLSSSFGDNIVAWYENLEGTGTFGPLQVINTSADGAASIFSADLNGDGARDVIAALSITDQVAWYENRLGTLDINDDGLTNAADLALLLGHWGPNPQSPADTNGDGVVDAADLAVLLSAWGTCCDSDFDCNDSLPCTLDSCDANLGCLHVEDDGSCDDGDLCTFDACELGECVHMPLACPPDEFCLDGVCVRELESCVAAKGGCCSDNGSPACDDPQCCNKVCNTPGFEYCCDTT